MSNDQWLELLKYLGFALGLYSAIRVDLATLKVRVDQHEKEITRIDKALDK